MNYDFLDLIIPPKTISEGLELLGTKELVGKASNPVILEWAKECGIAYIDDDVPWCGLFASVVTKRAGWEPVASPLWARNWANFGNKVSKPGLGDILVFERGTGGHVGFYIAEDDTAYHVLGGNQGNMVSITRIAKDRLLSANRPIWKIKQPDSVKPYYADEHGDVSIDEA